MPPDLHKRGLLGASVVLRTAVGQPKGRTSAQVVHDVPARTGPDREAQFPHVLK
jgi:hypothetical protein